MYEQLATEGDSLFSEKKYSEAIQAWGKALTVNGHAVELYFKSGLACVRLEDYLNAEHYFNKAIEHNPDDWDAWIKVGEMRLYFEDDSAAQEIWDSLPADRKKEPDAAVFHGDLLFLRQKLDEAEQAYQQALVDDEQNQEAIIKLAICLFAGNRSKEADQLFERLEALTPSDVKILILMANYCRLGGKALIAEKYYSEALRVEPSNFSCRLGLAGLYTGSSQKEKALEVLQPVIGKVNMTRSTEKLFAAILLSLNQSSEAGKILDELYQEKKDDIDVLMLKGNYHLTLNEPALAVAFYQAVSEINPQFAPARYWLGTAYLLCGHEQLGLQSLITALSIDNNFGEAELAIADFFYKKKKYGLAAEYARRATDRDKRSFRGFMILGNIYFEQKQYADAVEMFQNAETLAPDSISAKYYKAKALELDGKKEEALTLYGEVLKHKPTLADVGKSYAMLLTNSSRVEEAIGYFKKSAEEMPQNGYIQQILGQVYMVAGRNKEAVNAFKLAIDYTPELGSAYIKLSDIYAKDNETEKQEKILKKAIDNIPRFSEAYARLGLLYLDEHREVEAVRLLEKAHDTNRNDPFIANNLASIYLDMGINSIEAFDLAQSAYKKLPDNPAFSDTLGWAYCKRGIYRMALWYFNEALHQFDQFKKKQPEDYIDRKTFNKTDEGFKSALAAIHYHLGVALFKSGQSEKAAEAIKKAIKLGLRKSDKAAAEKIMGLIFAPSIGEGAQSESERDRILIVN